MSGDNWRNFGKHSKWYETNTSSNENASITEYWAPVEKAMGENGNISSDGAIKFTTPMTVNVTLDGITNPAS